MDTAALFIVDVQNDFLPPQGALAVPDGREVVAEIQAILGWEWKVIVASQDYHPPGHISFASTHSADPFTTKTVTDGNGKTYEQQLWPDHCVVGTSGVDLEKSLEDSLSNVEPRLQLCRKAFEKDVEAYSVFEGQLCDTGFPISSQALPANAKSTGSLDNPDNFPISRFLRDKGITRVVVTGLAADYCVLQTALSSIAAGFETLVVGSAVRGIKDTQIEDGYSLIRQKGGQVLTGTTERETWMRDLRAFLV